MVQGTIKDDDELSKVQQKCKDTVSHFHRSVKSAEKLREVQQQLSLPDHKLIQEVSTRWNSTYLMFERVIEQFDGITTALCLTNQSNHCFDEKENSLMSDSLTVFKPFLEATENISGDKYVSASMIIPLVKLLRKSMMSHTSFPLAAKLSAELSQRFAPIEGAYVTAVTTLLDPHFKKLSFTTPSASEHAVTLMTTEVSQLRLPDNVQQQESIDTSPNPGCSLWDAFDKTVTDVSSHRTTHTESTIEIRRYFEEANIERCKDPLQWWKENESRFVPKTIHSSEEVPLCTRILCSVRKTFFQGWSVSVRKTKQTNVKEY